MKKILGIAGAKQAGKSTSANFIVGYELKRNNVIEDFFISDKGELVCSALYEDDKGNVYSDYGILDLNQKTEEFEEYAKLYIWPLVKPFSFADKLKELCVDILGLSHIQCYGTDDDKNTYTNLRWENMPDCPNKSGFMTAREVLQFVGTEIFRKIEKNVWVNATIKNIQKTNTKLAIITDCRFVNEFEAIKNVGGKIVYLTKNSDHNDFHPSEIEMRNYDKYDAVIDNRNMTIQQANQKLLEKIVEWGMTNHIVKPKFASFK